MSASAVEDFADPLAFDLSEEEARIAAARAGFRGALRRRFSLRHVAPLVAFVLLMAFAAILGLTGLLPRRLAEAAILVAAIAFMASRIAARWRLRRAQSDCNEAHAACAAGPKTVTLDAGGLSVQTASGRRRFDYKSCGEAEMAGALIYLWLESDEPAIIPTRVFSSEQAGDRFVAALRAGIARGRPGRR